MDNTNDILDSTLGVVSNSLDNFDSTLGKIPIYKAGHNLGGFISSIIDKMVDVIPMDNNHETSN